MSARVDRACALFGIEARRARSSARVRAEGSRAAEAIDRLLRPGEIAMVTGPSGAGKSTVLRLLHRRLEARERVVRTPARLPGRPVVDLFRTPVEETLRLLALAGLAEATVFARRPAELSDGQRFRLRLAVMMARACSRGGPSLVLVDEFASTLDRTTARCVARTFWRWVSRNGSVRAVCATAHNDILEPLSPAVLAYVPLGGEARVARRTKSD